MRYAESKEQSAELLRKVVALMGLHDAAFHPTSYAVWYEFAAGTNSRLNNAIETALKSESRLGDATMANLFEAYVADVDPTVMQRISGEMNTMMNGILTAAMRTGDRAGAFGEQLTDLSTALSSFDSAALTSRVAEAIAGTAQMKSSALELNEQVQVSRQEIEKLQVDLARARDEALTDPLTRALNRKGFDQQLAQIIAQPAQPGNTHCMVMLDIDHFKQVNDTHGHVMGDRVIQAFAEVLRSSLPDATCALARYGGEEFAILMPNCSLEQGVKVADAMRLRTKAMKIRDRRSQAVVLTITVSAGVATVLPGDDAQDLVSRADKALYKSKETGRDCVTAA